MRSSGPRSAACARTRTRPEREPPVPADVFRTLWRRYEQAKARAEPDRLRGHADAGGRAVRDRCRRAGADASALQLVQRRRVPGHESAPGGPAAPVAGRSPRPVRGRRPRPDDLQLHRRQQRVPGDLRGPIPRRARRAPEPQLPQHPAGPRARQPADPRSRASLERSRRTDAGARPPLRRRRRVRRGGRAHPVADRRGRAGHRDRDPRPHERAAGAVRGRPDRRRDPVHRSRRPLLRPTRRPRRRSRPANRCRPGACHTIVATRWRTELGFDEAEPPGTGAEARDRHAALGTLLAIARALEAEQPDATVADFVAELARRDAAEADAEGGGVTLSTLHRAKGLEWDAVFLPQLEEGTLPIRQSASDADALAEERRLLYVGITRARRHLVLSWAASRIGTKGTRFVPAPRASSPSCGRTRSRGRHRSPGTHRPTFELSAADEPLLEKLIDWRRQRARADGVPAYVVADNKTLAAIAVRRPSDGVALLGVPGIGQRKVATYGDEILEIVRAS